MKKNKKIKKLVKAIHRIQNADAARDRALWKAYNLADWHRDLLE